jgi:hypothetical protein
LVVGDPHAAQSDDDRAAGADDRSNYLVVQGSPRFALTRNVTIGANCGKRPPSSFIYYAQAAL